jgi:hypothetical protein
VFRVDGSGLRVQGEWFRVQQLGFKGQGYEAWLPGSGFMVWGVGLGV